MLGTIAPKCLSSKVSHYTYRVWYILPHCLQASFQNNKYQLWLANYVFEIYFLIEVYTVVGDTLYCTTMYCIYALQ